MNYEGSFTGLYTEGEMQVIVSQARNGVLHRSCVAENVHVGMEISPRLGWALRGRVLKYSSSQTQAGKPPMAAVTDDRGCKWLKQSTFNS